MPWLKTFKRMHAHIYKVDEDVREDDPSTMAAQELLAAAEEEEKFMKRAV